MWSLPVYFIYKVVYCIYCIFMHEWPFITNIHLVIFFVMLLVFVTCY